METFVARTGKTLELYDPFIGELLDGRYRILARIGEGATTVVYAAIHIAIDRKVAVKILRDDLTESRRLVDRFLEEAKIASRIDHPNVVKVLDFGRVGDGGAFLVMELLEGAPLSDHIRKNAPVDPDVAVGLVAQVCRAVAAAHQKGVVHRDLKPDNLFVVPSGEQQPSDSAFGKDIVKVTDFAVAKMDGERSTLTKTGLIAGTPEYMAPEQAAGGGADRRTDIYSLGIVLYELLAGEVPFRDDSFMGVLSKQMFADPPDLVKNHRELAIPAPLSAIVKRALAKRPEDRFESMTDFQAALVQYEVHGTYQPAAEAAPEPTTAPTSDPVTSHLQSTGESRASNDARSSVVGGRGIRIHYPGDDSPAAEKRSQDSKEHAPRVSGSKLPEDLVGSPGGGRATRPARPMRAGRGWLGGSTRSSRRLAAVVWGGAALSIGLLVGLVLMKTGLVRRGERRRRRAAPTRAAPSKTSRAQRAAGRNRNPQGSRNDRGVFFVVNTIPEHANVFVEGEWIGRSPLIRTLPVRGRPVVVEVRRRGYGPIKKRVSLDRATYLELNLVPANTAKARKAAPARGAARRPRARNLGELKDPF